VTDQTRHLLVLRASLFILVASSSFHTTITGRAVFFGCKKFDNSQASKQSVKMADCTVFSEQRYKCHAVYGKGGEDCLHQELSEKRCLSLKFCPRQAHEYYGDFPMSTAAATSSDTFPLLVHKGLCASWAESFAYADKALEYGSTAAEHHQRANEMVSKDRTLKQECRSIAFALAQCLRQHKLF
jgi:hypothetical protein